MSLNLSIITINLNNAEGLQKTIESVINQTYKSFEYIVIDGASTDNSVDIIRKYKDSITFWLSEPDKGIYNAMNKGIQHAQGEYCLFLNSGDYLSDTDALAHLFSFNPVEEIVYSNLMMERNESRRLQKFPNELSFYWFYTQFLGHPSTLIKRELFKAFGLYNENYKIVSDWEFFLLTICKYQCSTKHIDFPLAVLVEGGISNSKQYTDLVEEERRAVLSEHFKLFKADYDALYDLRYNNILKRTKRFIKNL